MFNWISPFNYDFAIASIPIQIILLLFYGFRRNLPIRQSVFFWIAMSSNLIMTISDIISCEMNEVWMIFPLWVMYAINHAYFLGFIIRGWSLFMYTAESTHSYRKSDHIFKIIASLPAFISVILILSTPWTSAIYTIAEDGYHNCSLYKTIYFSTYFYIIASLFLVIRFWKQLSRRMKAGLLSFNLLLLFGIIIRKQFYHMLVTSYFSILTILIIFLTSENPDLYRDNRTSLLNKNALNRIGKELWERKIPFSLITISINNYEASKVVYGVNQINDELKIIAAWLVQNYRNNYLFYTRNGVFIVLIKGHLEKDPSMVINEWIEKYELLRKSCDDIVPIQASMMFLSESLISEHALLVSDLARYAINSSFEENRKGNYYFSDKMIEGVKKHKAIEKAIKLAMSEKRFEVYFQPIYSNADGKVMGAELSLDDFGTGAANLTSLINLPIHVVKVDMSFVRSYFAGKAGFLPDLISLFKHSRMEIVVEGIETLEMKDKMAELGCDYEQGYYFSKPIPPAEFITYMEAQAGQV